MYWTETAIARHLEGRFYQLQQKSLGSFAVIDLNEPDEEPEPPPTALAPVEVMPDPIEPREDGTLWLEDVAAVVCVVFNVTKVDLRSERRTHNVIPARMVFYWLARNFTRCSLPKIGAWCGGRDHSTVLHGVNKIDQRLDEFRTLIEICLSRLGVSIQQEAA